MCDLIKIMILQMQNEKLLSHLLELGCPGFDMSLGRSNMKLRIELWVCSIITSKKGNWSMVNSVTNK